MLVSLGCHCLCSLSSFVLLRSWRKLWDHHVNILPSRERILRWLLLLVGVLHSWECSWSTQNCIYPTKFLLSLCIVTLTVYLSDTFLMFSFNVVITLYSSGILNGTRGVWHLAALGSCCSRYCTEAMRATDHANKFLTHSLPLMGYIPMKGFTGDEERKYHGSHLIK